MCTSSAKVRETRPHFVQAQALLIPNPKMLLYWKVSIWLWVGRTLSIHRQNSFASCWFEKSFFESAPIGNVDVEKAIFLMDKSKYLVAASNSCLLLGVQYASASPIKAQAKQAVAFVILGLPLTVSCISPGQCLLWLRRCVPSQVTNMGMFSKHCKTLRR
ncbi:hypothetical protein BKA80DRAFT_275084 [Phyllosticta citrichinensis]